MSGWFSPSGGLFYHFKALRHSKKLWGEFRRHLQDLETDWASRLTSAQKENLVLIGGSGGHVQSENFLKSFQNIIHVDIDPFARFHFRRNFPDLHVTFLRQSAFKDQGIDPVLMESYTPKNSSWLFSNLLGQMGLYHDEQNTRALLRNVIQQMSAREWMSFHDLYSTFTPLKDLNLKATYASWEEVQKDIQKLSRPSFELADHLTHGMFDFHSKKILLWPLTPTQIHFVEVGFFSGEWFEEPGSP